MTRIICSRTLLYAPSAPMVKSASTSLLWTSCGAAGLGTSNVRRRLSKSARISLCLKWRRTLGRDSASDRSDLLRSSLSMELMHW